MESLKKIVFLFIAASLSLFYYSCGDTDDLLHNPQLSQTSSRAVSSLSSQASVNSTSSSIKSSISHTIPATSSSQSHRNAGINLFGPNPFYLKLGDEFVDPGFSAYDDSAGATHLVEVDDSDLNNTFEGIYSIIYSFTSYRGNHISVERAIIVNPDSTSSYSPGTNIGSSSISSTQSSSWSTQTSWSQLSSWSTQSAMSSLSQSSASSLPPNTLPGYYGVVADFEGPLPIADVSPRAYMYVFASQNSTTNNITDDEYGLPAGLIIEDLSAPRNFGIGHIDVTISGYDHPEAGFGFMFEEDESVTYQDPLDNVNFGGMLKYDYSDIESITFYAKGSGPWYFHLKSAAYVGLEEPVRYDRVEITFPLTSTWKQITLTRNQLIPLDWSGEAPSQEDILRQVVGVEFFAKEPATTRTDAEIFVDYIVFNRR